MTSSDPTPDQMVADRYRLINRLGTGGMSTVMLAHDTVLERQVALKMLAEHLADDQDFVVRFRHEALAVAQLQHPNIVQVYDSGHDDATGRQFIVMEYVAGPSLADQLRDHNRLDPGRAVQIAVDAANALDCAHRANIVHRDVKPANLIISSDGTAKLTDFGIAKAAAQSTRVTQAGSVLGTVAYLSPEQATGGETGAASDIYSLAVCVYQMLTGRLPFDYQSITELAIKQQQEQPARIRDLVPSISRELDDAVCTGLNFDPALRYHSALEFANALKDGLRGVASDATTRLLQAARTGVAVNAGEAVGGAARRRPMSARAAAGADDPTRVAAPAPVAQRAAMNPRPPAPIQQTQPAAHQAGSAAGGAVGKRRRTVAVVLVLLALAIAGAAAIAGFELGKSDAAPVIEQTVDQQIEGIRNFIEEHRQ